MALEQSSDVAARAVARALQQYRDATAPGLVEVIEALGFEIQDVEDAAWSVLLDTPLAVAIGFNLERIGKLVGQPRNGMVDETYWLWIQARIKTNKSSGSIDQIIAIFALLNDGATPPIFEEQFPAAFALKIHGIAGITAPDQQAAILRQARKAGVRSVLEYSTAPTGSGFTFAGGDGKGFPDALGTPGSGGKLAGAES